MVGGLTSPVQVVPVQWEKGPIYTSSNFPILPQRFTNLLAPMPALVDVDKWVEEEAMLGTGHQTNDNTMISCSRKVLMELCQGKALSALPPEVRQFVYGNKKSTEISLHTLEDLVVATKNQANVPHNPHSNLDEEGGVQAEDHTRFESQPPTATHDSQPNPNPCTPDENKGKSTLESEFG